MPEYVIRIEGFAGGPPTTLDGGWLKAADIEAFDGRGDAEATATLADALRFPSAGDAITFWRQQSRLRPLRPDGQPNRPLTAFDVTIEPVP